MGPAPEDRDPALVERAFRQAPFSLSIFDARQRYRHLNDTACETMGLAESALRGHTFPYGVPPDVSHGGMLQALRDVVETGKPVHYESFTRAPAGLREHAWNMELWPIRDESGEVSAVGLAAFDSSEQHWARQRLAMLDEAAVSIGRSLDLERTARELTELVVPRFADFASVDLYDTVLRGEEPMTGRADGPVVLRRVAHLTGEPGFPEAAVRLGASDEYPAYSPPAQALRLGEAVLSTGTGDVDFDRWLSARPERSETLAGASVTSLMAVPLIARGSTLGVVMLLRVRPEPFDRDDFTLARELTGRAALCVDNARRYTRERSTALALQASLLPHGPSPRQSAMDVAYRYQPTDSTAGVGGDWFDVIPLSGARVALVVGDVVGHGIQASATMGRLRTAVQTLADVDLPPDELLAHLDDLVQRLDEDRVEETGEAGRRRPSETGASCLYAVYDPVARTLAAASAGHPPPVLVLPGGSPRVMRLSVGPVLGVGGLPFELTEQELPEGTLVAAFSDGLIEAQDGDPDHGIERLREVLAGTNGSLEESCTRILDGMLPAHPRDDVALVLACTKALHSDHVRVWDLPADSWVVAYARRVAGAQLEEWGLPEAAYVTELVVSELVTNAIRYGSEPIQLRLIYDRTLICEVSDGNSTSPHLRRARTYDEGGRGLLLVAQLTKNWGTRHTATGKTIWTEQALEPGPIPLFEF
jgi:anti-sigma regulatory factor (Ser/Thr protein kinase)